MKSFYVKENLLQITSAPNESSHIELNKSILEAKIIDLGANIAEAYQSSVQKPQQNIKEVLGFLFCNIGISAELKELIIRDPRIDLTKEDIAALNGRQKPIKISFPNGLVNSAFLNEINNDKIGISVKSKIFIPKPNTKPSPVVEPSESSRDQKNQTKGSLLKRCARNFYHS